MNHGDKVLFGSLIIMGVILFSSLIFNFKINDWVFPSYFMTMTIMALFKSYKINKKFYNWLNK